MIPSVVDYTCTRCGRKALHHGRSRIFNNSSAKRRSGTRGRASCCARTASTGYQAAAERDAAAAAHAGEITRLEAQRAALERQLAVIGKQLEDSREAERAAAQEAADAARRLATAEVRASTLEQVHNALMQRVSPETKGTGE